MTSTKGSLWVGLVTLLLFATPAGAAGGGAQEIKQSPYYPLAIGTTWKYKFSVVGGTFTLELEARVAKHEKVGDLMCGLVETSRDGKVSATEHVGVGDDAVYRASYGGNNSTPPIRILKLPPKVGDTFTVDSKIANGALKGSFKVGEDEIEVMGKKHKAFTVTTEDMDGGDGNKIVQTVWFVEGLGIAKQKSKLGGKEYMIQLEKFEAGK